MFMSQSSLLFMAVWNKNLKFQLIEMKELARTRGMYCYSEVWGREGSREEEKTKNVLLNLKWGLEQKKKKKRSQVEFSFLEVLILSFKFYLK